MSEKVYEALFHLQEELFISYGAACAPNASNGREKSTQTRRLELLNKVESIVLENIESMTMGRPIELTFRSLTWKNTSFSDRVEMKTGADAQMTTVRFNHAPSRPKLLLMVRLLEKIHELLQNESTVTQRELYYQLSLQCKQNTMGHALRDVCSLLNASPWELGILSSGKGLVSGPLLIHVPQSTVDCSQRGGVLIPSDVAQVTKLESNAKFVLLVEKDAIFQKFVVDENIHQHLGPLIVITGKGFPDIGTRQLVRAIWDHLGIPILALVDADPHGLEIMCVYRFGSMSKSDLPHLTVPAIRWLGIHPTDITELLLPQSSLKPLTDADKKKAEQLLQKPYIIQSPALKRQIEALQRIGKKAEIEDVGNIKNAYLTDVYLPFKISSKQYL